ncbi:MBL fold metallo-hydrolase [Polaromonas sp. P1-6]|nr:MBL fold metallo-hydrolase [Polaromonas sp. P1-6]
MIVERIWTGNAYRNFNYLVACPETGEALAIDPLDHEKTLATAKVKGWQITQVLNTHEHRDHTGGNDAVIAGHRRQADRPLQRGRAHCRGGPRREGRRRDQGRQDRRA